MKGFVDNGLNRVMIIGAKVIAAIIITVAKVMVLKWQKRCLCGLDANFKWLFVIHFSEIVYWVKLFCKNCAVQMNYSKRNVINLQNELWSFCHWCIEYQWKTVYCIVYLFDIGLLYCNTLYLDYWNILIRNSHFKRFPSAFIGRLNNQ